MAEKDNLNLKVCQLSSQEMIMRFQRRVYIVCSIFTAVGAFFAGCTKKIWIIPLKFNSYIGLTLLIISVALGIILSKDLRDKASKPLEGVSHATRKYNGHVPWSTHRHSHRFLHTKSTHATLATEG
jgi:hypothetical protein